MDKFQLGYSDKNIPIPSQDCFLKRLISKTGNFINRIRWKAFFFDKDHTSEHEENENFGFKTEKSPPTNAALAGFENDLYDLISNIKFKKIDSEFQKKLNSDITKIKKSKKIIVSADKSTNLYKMEVDQYRKIVKENVTKTYKKAPETTEKDINQDASKIVTKLKLAEKVQQYSSDECFVTLKDHKDNFNANPQCRLINPAKSQVGKISKQLLQKTVAKVKEKSGFNLWKNDDDAIVWFSKLDGKKNSKFIKFDIESFYPSITETLLNKALEYAKTLIDVEDSDLEIIHHARKSLLFSESSCWMKKNGDLFDVTMGAYDGAEVCELVGLYLLSKIKEIIPQSQVGLYRDDGLAAIPSANGSQLDRIRKKLHKCFKEENLKIVVQINMTTTDFLDIYFDLRAGTHRPFQKDINTLQYIHSESNHPKSIKKNIPKMIADRLSKLSSNKDIFDEEKCPYEDAIKSSGYDEHLRYQEPQAPNQKRKRRRNVLWYNPPFSQSVSTNIGREFLNILARNFPQQHKYHKIFNRNTVKISYSCMPNMKNIIKAHNMSLLKTTTDNHQSTQSCNCDNKESCPLQGNCLTESSAYSGTITIEEDASVNFKYIGIAEGYFKTRYNDHGTSFKPQKYSYKT